MIPPPVVYWTLIVGSGFIYAILNCYDMLGMLRRIITEETEELEYPALVYVRRALLHAIAFAISLLLSLYYMEGGREWIWLGIIGLALVRWVEVVLDRHQWRYRLDRALDRIHHAK